MDYFDLPLHIFYWFTLVYSVAEPQMTLFLHGGINKNLDLVRVPEVIQVTPEAVNQCRNYAFPSAHGVRDGVALITSDKRPMICGGVGPGGCF